MAGWVVGWMGGFGGASASFVDPAGDPYVTEVHDCECYVMLCYVNEEGEQLSIGGAQGWWYRSRALVSCLMRK